MNQYKLYFYTYLLIFIPCISLPLLATETIRVTTKPLSELLISANKSAPASVISLNHVTLSTEISGLLTQLNLQEGDTVKKGQTLARIDCRNYTLAKKQAESALNVAKIQLNYAKKQFVRIQNLVRQGTVPRESFDRAEFDQQAALADIALKQVTIQTAQLSIERCRIKAPFDGQVTEKLSHQGQLVTTGTPLLKLLQTDAIEVTADLSPNEISALQAASKLEFIVHQQRLPVTPRTVIQTVNETTRTQQVRLSLLATATKSPPAAGQSGRIEWSDTRKLIPADYILRRNGKLGVMIAKSHDNHKHHTAKFITLENAAEGQPAAISLPATTRLIDENRFRLRDGDSITINSQ